MLKDTVRVGLSGIHGTGIFAERPLKPGDMIIEYAGETIRPCLTVGPLVNPEKGLLCGRPVSSSLPIIRQANSPPSQFQDKREKYYDSRSIGCYMFRIDDDVVVDATLVGNAGRFINHSCDPNCASRIIQVEGAKHIVIFAERPIEAGEELTYDYKVSLNM
jgi:SET domain-containing protein